ncbi:MAG: tripartite tricarboxylate transporter TctB family protein [Alphaproteobacteria bacterium]|nr:tripartite tricarboxylate transporter TctB family protein [Alphaproteobacteria bacterium]
MVDDTGVTVAEASPPSDQPTRADALMGIVFVFFGLIITFEAWRMPRMEEFGSNIWSAPGVVPGMIGICLTLMGFFLFMRSRQALNIAPPKGEPGSRLRVLITLGLCFGFAFVAVGLIPFVLAAFLFLFSFIMIFDLQDRRVEGKPLTGNALVKRIALAFTVAAVAAWTITTVFEDVFFVRLP